MDLDKLIEIALKVREKEGNINVNIGMIEEGYMQCDRGLEGLAVKEDSRSKFKTLILHEKEYEPTPYYKEDRVTIYK